MDYVYVDNSNLYIEGRRVSAVQQGIASNIFQAMNNGILDQGYIISVGKLHEFLCGNDGSRIQRIALFGSRPPPNDGIGDLPSELDSNCIWKTEIMLIRKKKIDTGIATLMMRDAYKNGNAKEDTFVLVAGDSDYVPTIKGLRDDGFNVEVVFWGHAAREIREAASKFIELDGFLDALRL